MFGCPQFLGVGPVDMQDEQRSGGDGRDGDTAPADDDFDLAFFQDAGKGDGSLLRVGIPLRDAFPDSENFPYFVQPYTLNTQAPNDFMFWVRVCCDACIVPMLVYHQLIVCFDYTFMTGKWHARKCIRLVVVHDP
jgi:hypothetical protein